MGGRSGVLEILRGAQGYLSGEEIAEALGKSRAAVWKQVERLRAMGYVIQGSPRLGYRLDHVPDEPLAHEISARLPRTYPGQIRYFTDIGSTNDEAKKLAQRGAPAGSIVVAGSQSNGRGRYHRPWFSCPGGLWMSVVIRPKVSMMRATRLAVVTAVVAAEALEAVGASRVRLKWPNDILCGDKKLAGILIEAVAEIEALSFAIVGIGINANFSGEVFPREIRRTSTTLLDEIGHPVDLAGLAAKVGSGIGEAAGHLDDGSMADWRRRWLSKGWWLGRPVVIRRSSEEVRGILADIDLDGSLVLGQEDGGTKLIRLGEASMEAGRGGMA